MPTVEFQLPEPYPKQREAIWSPARISVIEASTKAGKTSGCIFWLLEQCIARANPTANYWWVAPVYAQTRVAFDRICDMLLMANREQSIWSQNQSDMFIRLEGCGRIWFKSGDRADNLYGDDVFAAVIDEATRCDEKVWHAIRSVLTATGGPVRIIGNVVGRTNWVRALAAKAEGSGGEISYHKLTAYDAVEGGVLPIKEVEDAKSQLPDHVFRQLYLAEPPDDGGNPFGLDHIAACVGPASPNPPMVFGVDLAKGSETGDETVIIGLDDRGNVCYFDHFRDGWEAIEEKVSSVIQNTPTLVDTTGVGSPVYDRMLARGLPVEPFAFSLQSKQRLMGSLAQAIRQRRVTYPNGQIVRQLETFEYQINDKTGNVTYSAPRGFHDDCVYALALAVFHAERCGRASVTLVGGEKEAQVVAPREYYEQKRADPDWGF